MIGYIASVTFYDDKGKERVLKSTTPRKRKTDAQYGDGFNMLDAILDAYGESMNVHLHRQDPSCVQLIKVDLGPSKASLRAKSRKNPNPANSRKIEEWW